MCSRALQIHRENSSEYNSRGVLYTTFEQESSVILRDSIEQMQTNCDILQVSPCFECSFDVGHSNRSPLRIPCFIVQQNLTWCPCFPGLLLAPCFFLGPAVPRHNINLSGGNLYYDYLTIYFIPCLSITTEIFLGVIYTMVI
jgi:hypothetical protein